MPGPLKTIKNKIAQIIEIMRKGKSSGFPFLLSATYFSAKT